MPDLISVLSTQTGISPDLIRKGVAVLLSYLKGKLDPTLFALLEAAFPAVPAQAPASDPAAKVGHDSDSGSGLIGSIASLAGKLFGEKAAEPAHVMSSLSDSGLSADQIQAFLPAVFALFNKHLPPEAVEQIQAHLPTLATADAPAPELKSGPA